MRCGCRSSRSPAAGRLLAGELEEAVDRLADPGGDQVGDRDEVLAGADAHVELTVDGHGGDGRSGAVHERAERVHAGDPSAEEVGRLEVPHLPRGSGTAERAAAEGAAAHLEHGAFVTRFVDVDAADVGGDVAVVLLDPGGVPTSSSESWILRRSSGEFLDPTAELGAESVEGVLDLEVGHVDERRLGRGA